MDKWLCSNKLSLNVSKSSFVIFHPSQKKLPFSAQSITNLLRKRNLSSISWGYPINNNLKWKEHVNYFVEIFKLRYFVDQATLVSLYYALVYPYLIINLLFTLYSTWGHTYKTIIKKRAIQIITFSSYCDHSAVLSLNF